MEGDGRLALAGRVLSALEHQPAVRHTFLRGSLVNGPVDRFSDIDIAVDVSGSDNGQFMLDVPSILGRWLDLEFHDFVPSLMPDAYVVNVYLRETPIFWNVDIECLASPHLTSVRTAPADKTLHLLKLWVLTAKYLLRGAPRAADDLARLAPRILGGQSGGAPAEQMSRMLEQLKGGLGDSHAQFLAQCDSACAEIAAMRVE